MRVSRGTIRGGHMGSSFYIDLSSQLEKHGIVIKKEQILLLERHWQLLQNENKKFNLTAIRDEDEAIIKHYLDSLILLSIMKDRGIMLDIGSGPGFPGMPLAIADPDREYVLLEATGKRAKFLETIKEELKINNVSIINNRAEKAAHDKKMRASFHYVAARAVSSLAVLLEYAIPFLETDGIFMAMKGPEIKEEILLADNALRILNAKIIEIIEYRLADTTDRRTIILIKKAKETSDRYPRREGKPEKSPL